MKKIRSVFFCIFRITLIYATLLIVINFFSPVCQGGKYAADFLSIGAGGRALALGSAAVANSDDAFSAYWNPAALVRVKNHSLGMMHAAMFSGLENYNFASFISTFENESIGISWIRLGIDDIPIYPELEGTPEERLIDNSPLQPSGEPSGYLTNLENAFFLSYAHASVIRAAGKPFKSIFPIAVSWGGNFKYLTANSGTMSSRGLGFDIGTLFSTLPSEQNILTQQGSVGVMLQDVTTTKIKWSSNHRDAIPINLKLGIAYTMNLLAKYSFTLVFDLETRHGLSSHVGFEAKLKELIALRLGVNDSDITAGCGLSVRNFILDYAFRSSDLANSHFISLQMVF